MYHIAIVFYLSHFLIVPFSLLFFLLLGKLSIFMVLFSLSVGLLAILILFPCDYFHVYRYIFNLSVYLQVISYHFMCSINTLQQHISMSSLQPLCCYCYILPFTYGYQTHNMSLFSFKMSIIFKGGLNNKINIAYFLMSSAALSSPILGPTNSSCLGLPRLETVFSIQGD